MSLTSSARMMLSIYTTQRLEELREKGIVWEDAPTPAQEEQILAIVKENFAPAGQL